MKDDILIERDIDLLISLTEERELILQALAKCEKEIKRIIESIKPNVAKGKNKREN